MLSHPFPPLYNGNSQTLILGSFPSVKSREEMFFYGHPQNRFWRVLSGVFASPLPETIPEKRTFILSHHLALWDVLASCEISGSADSSIKNAAANDLSPILNAAPITRIFVNGKTAKKYYDRFIAPTLQREAVCLPSTSPANAAFTLEKLICAWNVIR